MRGQRLSESEFRGCPVGPTASLFHIRNAFDTRHITGVEVLREIDARCCRAGFFLPACEIAPVDLIQVITLFRRCRTRREYIVGAPPGIGSSYEGQGT